MNIKSKNCKVMFMFLFLKLLKYLKKIKLDNLIISSLENS